MASGFVQFQAYDVSAVFSLAGMSFATGPDNAVVIGSRSPGAVYLSFGVAPAGSLVARPDLPGCVMVPAGGVVTISGADLTALGAATVVAAWAPQRGLVRISSKTIPVSTSSLLEI